MHIFTAYFFCTFAENYSILGSKLLKFSVQKKTSLFCFADDSDANMRTKSRELRLFCKHHLCNTPEICTFSLLLCIIPFMVFLIREHKKWWSAKKKNRIYLVLPFTSIIYTFVTHAWKKYGKAMGKTREMLTYGGNDFSSTLFINKFS